MIIYYHIEKNNYDLPNKTNIGRKQQDILQVLQCARFFVVGKLHSSQFCWLVRGHSLAVRVGEVETPIF